MKASREVTMLVASFDVNEVLHQHSPLEAQLHANLNFVPAYAWYRRDKF